MPNYRAYVLGPDGEITRAHNFIADDDPTAKKHAAGYVNGHDVELWSGDTRVALLQRKDHVERSR
jgi:hypothetical protein